MTGLKRNKLLAMTPLLCFAPSFLSGCHFATSDKAEWRIEFTQGVRVSSEASKTAEETEAKAGIDLKDWTKTGILGWLFGKETESGKTSGGGGDQSEGR